jgi:4-hydroxythreonine-4-phosphate dehydrogenase
VTTLPPSLPAETGIRGVTASPQPGAPSRLWITPGEPAGIGPDLLIRIALEDSPASLTAVCDPQLLLRRAEQLGVSLRIVPASIEGLPQAHRAGTLAVRAVPLAVRETCGRPDPANARYVLDTLRIATAACLDGHADALVTGPVHKGIINDAGIPFSGHTEFLAELTGAALPVMMLVAGSLRVALATTHLPLRAVPDALTQPLLESTLRILHAGLVSRFGIAAPRILVCGLNPHAGESGHLGREEIEVIAPVLERLRRGGMQLEGPLPADTLFVPRLLATADAVLAMYHDQGLPVLKHAGFGEAVNITLGLPIIRTSVDHGTAFDLAGSGRADVGSLRAALEAAQQLAVRSQAARK